LRPGDYIKNKGQTKKEGNCGKNETLGLTDGAKKGAPKQLRILLEQKTKRAGCKQKKWNKGEGGNQKNLKCVKEGWGTIKRKITVLCMNRMRAEEIGRSSQWRVCRADTREGKVMMIGGGGEKPGSLNKLDNKKLGSLETKRRGRIDLSTNQRRKGGRECLEKGEEGALGIGGGGHDAW